MKNLAFLSLFIFLSYLTFGQINFTANDQVAPYNSGFHPGMNSGFFPGWTNEQLAELCAGNLVSGYEGVGAKAMRLGLTEEIAEIFGYDILVRLFDYYDALGMDEHTLMVGYPIDWHRDENFYCSSARSTLFDNLYEPIWDNGANGTAVNDENYFALYLFKLVSLYKDDVKFGKYGMNPDLIYPEQKDG